MANATATVDERAPEDPQLATVETDESRGAVMATVLWVLAVVLVVSGVVAILRKELLWGVVLIVVGLMIGPGGVSIFT